MPYINPVNDVLRHCNPYMCPVCEVHTLSNPYINNNHALYQKYWCEGWKYWKRYLNLEHGHHHVNRRKSSTRVGDFISKQIVFRVTWHWWNELGYTLIQSRCHKHMICTLILIIYILFESFWFKFYVVKGSDVLFHNTYFRDEYNLSPVHGSHVMYSYTTDREDMVVCPI